MARTLVLARSDRWAGPLCDGLDKLGWRTVTARSLGAALNALQDLGIEAVIIDTTEDLSTAVATAAKLKAYYAPRRLPVLGLGEPDGSADASPFDLIMRPPLHPAQTVLRLESLTRAAVTEEEFELRAQNADVGSSRRRSIPRGCRF
jgi:two-component system cell cycle response regulator PopA